MWKRKSVDKAAAAADKANTSLRRNEEEIQTLLNGKADMERELKMINDKLSSALSECNAKDELAKKQAQIAQEAISGWEKTEAEAMTLKQRLDKALQDKAADKERMAHLDAALKECMRQLRFVREDQEKRIHDAVAKTSREFEGTRHTLEEKLAEVSGRLTRSNAENTQLSKALLAKEKVIEDLKEQQTQMETDLCKLMDRLESNSKENMSLKYEVRVLEKELEIRNEERECNQRTVDVAHKQYLEGAKKIAKLESECQRLRVLVRKRLPGPAALAKMKSEVEILGRDPAEMRRRNSNPSFFGSTDFAVDKAPDTPRRRIHLLTQQLCLMEEENRSLKEALDRKVYELQTSRAISARGAPTSSDVERQVEDLQKGHINMDQGSTVPNESLQELSLTSMSDIGSEDKASCAGSWASALISELEHFKNGKQMVTPSRKSFGVSDINLMDDFVEMEKLAVGSTENPVAKSHHASQGEAAIYSPEGTQSSEKSTSDVRQRVSAYNSQSDPLVFNQQNGAAKINSNSVWLDDIVNVLWEQCYSTNRSADDLLQDIKAALAVKCHSDSNPFNKSKISGNLSSVCPSGTSGCIDLATADVCSRRIPSDREISEAEKSSKRFHLNVSTSLQKIIELVEGISVQTLEGRNSHLMFGEGNELDYRKSEAPTGYLIRAFQWKTAELSIILKQFVESCRSLSQGKITFDKFTEQLTCTLEWILNHCFSLQDVSSMKDAIKNHFDWDDAQSESEQEGGTVNHVSYSYILQAQRAELTSFTSVSGGNSCSLQVDGPQLTNNEENVKSKEKVPTSVLPTNDLVGELESEISRSKLLMIQVQKSEEIIKSLQAELDTLKQSNKLAEDQIEKQKLVNQELEAQITAAKYELDEACEKFLSLEKELENKSKSCGKLEATCHDLELQLSMAKKEFSEGSVGHKERQFQNDWEIEAASEKLAECQETILNLGKQLKSMASPKDAVLFDRLASNPVENVGVATEMASPKQIISRRSSLLETLLAEDNAEVADLVSHTTKEPIINGYGSKDSPMKSVVQSEIQHTEGKSGTGSLAIVPVMKKNGGGLLRKLTWRRRNSSKKM